MDSDRIEGKAKETEGEIQQKWGEAKDTARDTWEDVKDKVEDVADDAEDRLDGHDETDAKVEGALRLDELARDRPTTCVCVVRGPAQAGPRSRSLGRGCFEQLHQRVLGGGQVLRDGAVGRPEVGQRSPGEIVVHDDGAHVGGPRDRGRVAELLADVTHHRGERPLGLGLVSAGPRLSSSVAASNVPPHVRKSLAVNPAPRFSAR